MIKEANGSYIDAAPKVDGYVRPIPLSGSNLPIRDRIFDGRWEHNAKLLKNARQDGTLELGKPLIVRETLIRPFWVFNLPLVQCVDDPYDRALTKACLKEVRDWCLKHTEVTYLALAPLVPLTSLYEEILGSLEHVTFHLYATY